MRSGASEAVHTLAPAAACSMRATAPMQLRVLRGRAWVTLGTGPGGWRERSGDLFLHAGQSLAVPRGQRLVLEPLDGQPLQWQWRRAEAASAAADPVAAACPAQARACGA